MPKAKKRTTKKKSTRKKASSTKKATIEDVLRIQKQLLVSQKQMFSIVKEIPKREKEVVSAVTAERKEMEDLEHREIKELEQLEQLEKQIELDVHENPLRKITYRDFTKGMIGAFVGIVAHFSFLEGLHVAEYFTMTRASLMFLTSFIIGIAFLYFAGFRSVKDSMVLKIIPLRILVIYSSAIFVVVIVLFLFGIISMESHFDEVYKMVSAISVLAMLGACTADLIGKER